MRLGQAIVCFTMPGRRCLLTMATEVGPMGPAELPNMGAHVDGLRRLGSRRWDRPSVTSDKASFDDHFRPGTENDVSKVQIGELSRSIESTNAQNRGRLRG